VSRGLYRRGRPVSNFFWAGGSRKSDVRARSARIGKDDQCSLKKSILPSEKSPPLRRRAGESAENRKKESWGSKISVNFTDFEIIVRASQPRQRAVENGAEKCPDRNMTILGLYKKSWGKVPRPNWFQIFLIDRLFTKASL
jgi:hypothetical protein